MFLAALPDYVYDGWFGIIAPSRTPRPIIERLSKEVGSILELPEIREKIASQGGKAKSSTPEQFDKLIRDEIETRTKVFKAAGVRPE